MIRSAGVCSSLLQRVGAEFAGGSAGVFVPSVVFSCNTGTDAFFCLSKVNSLHWCIGASLECECFTGGAELPLLPLPTLKGLVASLVNLGPAFCSGLHV